MVSTRTLLRLQGDRFDTLGLGKNTPIRSRATRPIH